MRPLHSSSDKLSAGQRRRSTPSRKRSRHFDYWVGAHGEPLQRQCKHEKTAEPSSNGGSAVLASVASASASRRSRTRSLRRGDSTNRRFVEGALQYAVTGILSRGGTTTLVSLGSLALERTSKTRVIATMPSRPGRQRTRVLRTDRRANGGATGARLEDQDEIASSQLPSQSKMDAFLLKLVFEVTY